MRDPLTHLFVSSESDTRADRWYWACRYITDNNVLRYDRRPNFHVGLSANILRREPITCIRCLANQVRLTEMMTRLMAGKNDQVVWVTGVSIE